MSNTNGNERILLWSLNVLFNIRKMSIEMWSNLHYAFQASANLRATTFCLLFALFCFLFFVVLLFVSVFAFSLSVGQMIGYIMKHTLQFIYFTIIQWENKFYLQFRNYRLTLKIWFPICCANTLVIWRTKYVRLLC